MDTSTITPMSTSSSTSSQRYLCLSYNKYLITRKKLSDASKSNNNTDEVLRNKLITFIHMHPDHELRRQVESRYNTSNVKHKEMHTAKINELTDLANEMYEKRIAYKLLRDSEASIRLTNHIARMKAEKELCLDNKILRIQKAREVNAIRIDLEKFNGDAIRLSRAEKRKNKINNLV